MLLFLLFPLSLEAQKIVDPCFQSIRPGMFYRSDYIWNLCLCDEDRASADLLEWDEQSQTWLNTAENSQITIIPPEGCNTRAIWMGSASWTKGGEAFAMKLDKPLEPGKAYSYTFTYASTGIHEHGNFAPTLSTAKDNPTIRWSYPTTKFPPADDWRTETISFTTTDSQDGHNWLVFHTVESSGIILSNCFVEKPIADIKPVEVTEREYYCLGQTIALISKYNMNYSYLWSTGETTPTIEVTNPGRYSLAVSYGECTSEDEAYVDFKDCEVRLVMPNVFTPNNDFYNDLFVPMNSNYVVEGTLAIYNRWGEKIFTGDLFSGWNGESKDREVPTGIYYYCARYKDFNSMVHEIVGEVSILRD